MPGRRRWFLVAVTVAFVLACTVPYGIAAWRAPSDTRFSGVLLHKYDQHYYLGAQRSVAGRLDNVNRFTSEAGAPGPIAPLYPLVGQVQRLTGLPAMVVYHLPRVLAAVVFPSLLFWLFLLCFPDRPDRAMWGTVLALFAAGPVALAPGTFLAERSGDRVAEATALMSFGLFPHFAVAYVGLVLALVAVALAVREKPLLTIAAVAAAAGILLGLSHPFLLLVPGGVLAVLLVRALVAGTRGRASGASVGRLVMAGAAFVTATPFLLALRQADSELEDLRGVPFPTTRSDALWTWLLGFGVVTVLAVAGVVQLLRNHRTKPGPQLLLLWTGVQLALVYWPGTIFQRRFSEALIVPVAGLAALGVPDLRAPERPRRLGAAVLVVVLAVGAVAIPKFLAQWGENLPRDYVDLLAEVRPGDVVAASLGISSSLPAYSPGTSYAGRLNETIRYDLKRSKLDRYARDPASAESRRWLRDARITLVVVDRDDGSFLPRRPGEPGTCLSGAFDRERFAAYRVNRTCLDASPVVAPPPGEPARQP